MRAFRGAAITGSVAALLVLSVVVFTSQNNENVLMDREDAYADSLVRQAEGQSLAAVAAPVAAAKKAPVAPVHKVVAAAAAPKKAAQLVKKPRHSIEIEKHINTHKADKKVATAIQQLAGEDEDGMDLEVSSLLSKLNHMKSDLSKQEKTLRGAKPRLITVNVRPRGSPGRPGPPGPQGGPGSKGRPGPRGLRGPRGPVGYRGPIGDRGKRGHRGRPGRTGPNGPTGLRGPRGPPGLTGDEGVKGTRGPSGAPGAPGANGHDGARGAPGYAAGPGPVGKHGPRGPRGPTGPPGRKGAPGPRGNPGPQGPRGQVGMKGRQGLPGHIGPTVTYNPLNGLNIAGERTKRLKGGYARRTDVPWPSGQWALGMWVYVGKKAHKGATPFSYEADGDTRLVTLTDQCSKLYLAGQKVPTGFTCHKGKWTHVLVAYNGRQVSTYKNGKHVMTFDRSINVPAGGILTLGQDNNNSLFSRKSALAPGQLSAPQLFSTYLSKKQAKEVAEGKLKGNVLQNLEGYRLSGVANLEHVSRHLRGHHHSHRGHKGHKEHKEHKQGKKHHKKGGKKHHKKGEHHQ